MILEEEVKEMVDKILSGDKSLNILDVVKLMVNRILNGDGTIDVTDIVKLMVERRKMNESR